MRESLNRGYRGDESAFHRFADDLPFIVFEQDVTGEVSFANAAWHRVTGLPRDPSPRSLDAWRSVVHSDDLAAALEIVSNAVSSATDYVFECRVKRVDSGDDAYRWYLVRGVRRYSGGEFSGWIGSMADVHEAHARERDFHALAEAIPVIVWTADASGWIDWYNSRWYQYTGQTPEEAAGWGWQAAHHPEDFPRVMREWPHSIATGEPFETEFRLRRADGSFHTVLTRAVPIRNERGEVVRWYGSNVDIQAQKEALERTQRVAETLQSVFLPKELPHTPFMRVDAIYKAAEKDALVGGDWFDAMKLPDGRYLLSIGDVTGHGLDASVIAGRLRHGIRTCVQATKTKDPAYVLQLVNDIIRLEHPGVFATALAAFVEPESSRFIFASAGHPPPLVAKSRERPATMLTHGAMPLGVDEHLDIQTHEVQIERDDVVALYTDGITEFSRDIASAEDRLKIAVSQMVRSRVPRPAAAVADAVLGGAPAVDDAAMVVVQFSDITAAELEFDPTMLEKTWRFHSSDAYTAHMSRQELMRFVQRFAADPNELFTSELILGEILANTVEHAPGLVEVHIDWKAKKPIVTVLDTGPGLDHLLSTLPLDSFDENGRGLFLIKALAEDVTVRPSRGYGTELRAVLPISRREDVTA